MDCPHGATRLGGDVSRCTTCNRDLRRVVAALVAGEQTTDVGEAFRSAQDGRWRRQCHSRFDAMGAVLAAANPTIERLAQGAGEGHLIECQSIRTNRPDGPNRDTRLAVLWTLDAGVIRAGQHLSADQAALDGFFGATKGV